MKGWKQWVCSILYKEDQLNLWENFTELTTDVLIIQEALDMTQRIVQLWSTRYKIWSTTTWSMLRKPPEWMTCLILKSEYKTFLNWVVWRYSSSKVEKKNAQHYPKFSYKVLLPFFWNVFNPFPPILSRISCLNYVRPDFSRMRYVGGLCRPRSFLYQNFLFWLILKRGTTFDLIPTPMGYVGATTARSYTQ